MLNRLSADYEGFKTLEFRPGLNLVVARSTIRSTSTDSRNGSGKSSMIELIHFLLGARCDRKHLLAGKDLRQRVFSLDMDWPEVPEG